MRNHIEYTHYPINTTAQVYNMFDGWQQCQIIKHGWDHAYGRPTFHIVLTNNPNKTWITNSKYLRAAQ